MFEIKVLFLPDLLLVLEITEIFMKKVLFLPDLFMVLEITEIFMKKVLFLYSQLVLQPLSC